MKKWIPILLIAVLRITSSCNNQKVHYLDTDYPTSTPKKYAVGIINKNNRTQQNITMSTDGLEQIITITDAKGWNYKTLQRIKKQDDEILIDTPNFVKNLTYKNAHFIGEAMISPDNKKLVFIADYPPQLWHTNKTKDNEWDDAQKIHVLSSKKSNWYPTFSKNNHLFFTDGKLYKSIPTNHKYNSKTEIEFVENEIIDPCISPNGDYIIFGSYYKNGIKEEKSDLFISFKNNENNWSTPYLLNNQINTEHYEFAPYISPDEKFLFFSRRDRWQNATFSNIYWVSLDFIEHYRNLIE